jgi:hypothetical protein
MGDIQEEEFEEKMNAFYEGKLAAKPLTGGVIFGPMSDWPTLPSKVDEKFYMTTTITKPELTPQERKDRPIARGVLDYFPDALMEVAYVSKVGNDQHNPGQEMHWAKEKSTDHADCILRHLIDRGTLDTDGMRHSAKVAWRALALLQTELDKEKEGK